jgi:hypothetical protein
MTANMNEILLNMEVIAIDQDSDAEIGTLMTTSASGCTNLTMCHVWTRNLTDGSVAVLFVNMGEVTSQTMAVPLKVLFPHVKDTAAQVVPRDIWNHRDLSPLSIAASQLTVSKLAPHSCAFFRVRRHQPW